MSVETGEVREPEEILDAVFPTSDETEVMHPGEEPLPLPASTVAAQFSPNPAFGFCAVGLELPAMIGFRQSWHKMDAIGAPKGIHPSYRTAGEDTNTPNHSSGFEGFGGGSGGGGTLQATSKYWSSRYRWCSPSQLRRVTARGCR